MTPEAPLPHEATVTIPHILTNARLRTLTFGPDQDGSPSWVECEADVQMRERSWPRFLLTEAQAHGLGIPLYITFPTGHQWGLAGILTDFTLAALRGHPGMVQFWCHLEEAVSKKPAWAATQR